MFAHQVKVCLSRFGAAARHSGKCAVFSAALLRHSSSKARMGTFVHGLDQQPPTIAGSDYKSIWGSEVPHEVKQDEVADVVLPFTPEGRSLFSVPAADDFVKDYRELAALSLWDNLLDNASDNLRVLDVCSGTGRWAQAFSEIVAKDRHIPCDFIDLCTDSMGVLSERLKGITNLGPSSSFNGDICELSKLGVPTLSYDIVTNMHGLYGVPADVLPTALQAMHDSLKVGGTMIIAIGTDQSPYQQVPKQCLGQPVTNDADIIEAFQSIGIQASTFHIEYKEEYSATDQDGLDRFLLDECGGNCFPADVAQNLEFSIQGYADHCFDEPSQMYRFHHQIAVIVVQRR